MKKKNKKPTLHLTYGFIGCGKTTFAKKLEKDIGAIRFTHDEWMHKLYGSNPPEEKFQEYYERVEELIWKLTKRLLELGQDVILDFGFWSRIQRDRAREKAKKFGANCKLYYISCSEEEMLNRCLKRTDNLTDDSLYISEKTFCRLKGRFEGLGGGEEHVLINNGE